MEHALMCPQCNSPLAPHPFARSVVCAYCGATVMLDETSVSSSKFHDSYIAWNTQASALGGSLFSIDDRSWLVEKLIAHGEISDVYTGRLARWPTELVLIKVLRDDAKTASFVNEWTILNQLHASEAQGADFFTRLLPHLVLHGKVAQGAFAGNLVSIYRWMPGFRYSLDEVRQAYPQGIPPRASIWVWRRILEMLSFLHASGIAHAAVLPENLLLQDHEHGVRLVGYSFAGKLGYPLNSIPGNHREYYASASRYTTQLDLILSARTLISILGGDPVSCEFSAEVPSKLVDLLRSIARSDPSRSSAEDAWALRDRVGHLSDEIFGAPQFVPISMPPRKLGS